MLISLCRFYQTVLCLFSLSENLAVPKISPMSQNVMFIQPL